MGESQVQVKLGNNLDQLLYDKKYNQEQGGLFLPAKGDPGTGNIVIKGGPGTGKSTLALQMLYQTTKHKAEKALEGEGLEGQACSYFALYFSLEEQIDHIMNKMKRYSWKGTYSDASGSYDSLRKLIHLQNTDDATSPEKLSEYLKKILSQPENCKIREQDNMGSNPFQCSGKHVPHPEVHYGSYVLMPMLSPRGVSQGDDSIYWERYKQIEKYLIAAEYIKSKRKEYFEKSIKENKPEILELYKMYESIPDLKIVCIDSLNVFGDRYLNRDEIFRLFDLFKRYGIIGVFIFESKVERSDQDTTQMGNDIDFSADVVISLQNEQDGYMMRYLEVEKSRYRPQVYGKHPYYIVSRPDNTAGSKNPFLPFWVYPSLHYKLNEYAYEFNNMNSQEKSGNRKMKEDNPAGERGLEFTGPGGNGSIGNGLCKSVDGDLPEDKGKSEEVLETSIINWKEKFGNIIPDSLKRSFAIMLSGPRNTFKSVIAKEFLVQGHSSGNMEKSPNVNSMIICLGGKHYGSPDGWLHYEKPDYHMTDLVKESKLIAKYKRVNLENDSFLQKFSFEKWVLEENPKCFLLSVVINKKAISAEEFIHHLQYNLLTEEHKIKRVVLDEVNMIGVSYPFLKFSKTSNELFLNALVAMLRSKGIDLIMTGTSGEMAQSDDVINRAISLSNISLTTRFCDIFGKQNVIITGGGLVVNELKTDTENFTPGVLRVNKDAEYQYFTINLGYLNGLVGFENGKVYRPGLTINLYEEGKLQKEYNNQISIMYNLYFPAHSDISSALVNKKSVNITTFKDKDVEAIQETVKRIHPDYPLEGTVVSMVDEYWENENNTLPESANKKPYYTNCLVLAYRTDVMEDNLKEAFNQPLSWKEIYGLVKTNGNGKVKQNLCLMDADFFTTETLSCLFLDAMAYDYNRKYGRKLSDNKNDSFLEDVVKDFSLEDLEANLSENGITVQLYYLKLLLNSLKGEALENKYNPADNNINRGYKNMCPESRMYVCWYTQLREYLAYFHQHVPNIGITTLPGGGFSGDWMLEVMPGSLNKELGKNTLDQLCNPNEEIKRFIQGAGLPTWLKQYNTESLPDIAKLVESLPAWIGANKITLKDIGYIYSLANHRAKIKKYGDLRHMLMISFRRLMAIKLPENISEEDCYIFFREEAVDILDQLKKYIIKHINNEEEKKAE